MILSAAGAAAQVQASSTIRGIVIDARTGSPLPQVLVAVEAGPSAVTSQNGTFVLEGLPAGKVRLSVSMVGYGLVQRVVTKGKALESALEIAQQIAGFPQGCVNVDRQALYEGLGKPLAEGLTIEATLGRTVLEEAARGAARFAGGEGRHARF